MTFGDHDPRLKAAFTRAPQGAKPRSDCPPPQRIWHAARGELKPSELKQVVLHLCECPVCTEAWRLAEVLENDEDHEYTAPPPTVQQRRSFHPAYLGAVAAMLSAIIGLGILLRHSETAPPNSSPMRSSDTPASQRPRPDNRSTVDIELVGSEDLSRDDFLLQWNGSDDEDIRYRLLIMHDMEILAEARELRAREYRVKPEWLKELPDGAKLSVLIEARHPFRGRLNGATFYVTLQ